MYGAGLYGGGLYGGGMLAGGMGGITSPPSERSYYDAGGLGEANRRQVNHNDGDTHLCSIAEVTGYHVHAVDGGIGHVEDFIVDSESWGIRYLIVDTSNCWFGQHVLMSPHAVKEVNWSDHHIRLDFTRDMVKASPPLEPRGQY